MPGPSAVNGTLRADRMQQSVASALAGRGVAPDGAELVLGALRLAMEPRIRRLDDDHHPAYLHPGRSVLILLHDAAVLPPPASLSAAALHESRDDELRVSLAAVEAAMGDEVARLLPRIPLSGAADLAERLVVMGRDLALAALAEHLDRLRHLHLRPDHAAEWHALHGEVDGVWLPMAQRTDQRLAVRYAHWLRVFGKRLR